MPAQQAKNWCFTINNYTNEEKDNLYELCNPTNPTDSTPTYLIYGEEVGEECGTPHLQGYVSFPKKVTFNKCKELIGNRANIRVAKGSAKQNKDYCSKQGEVTEYGTPPKGQGARTDIAIVQKRIAEGATKEEIREHFFGTFCRYERAICNYISDVQPKRNWKTKVVVLWGKTGTGKTRSIFDYHNADQLYMHPGHQWFDGYEGQDVVVFDDYNGSEFQLSYLLKLTDRYPFKVPVKGGYKNWKPKVIYFTSNKSPDDWYVNVNDEQKAALKRRIDKIYHFDGVKTPSIFE